MKVSYVEYVESLASYGGLESCVHTTHALRRGTCISRLNTRPARDPARAEALRTHASTLFGNREVPPSSVARWEALLAERIEKPMGVQR